MAEATPVPRSAGASAAVAAPPPVPTPPAAAPVEGHADWKRFVEAVHSRDIAVGTCLAEAVGELGSGRLKVVFRPEHDFHRTQVGQAANQPLLEEAAAAVFGRHLQVEVATRPRDADEDELARRVKSEVAPDQQQHLARRASENPELGRLLDGLAGPD